MIIRKITKNDNKRLFVEIPQKEIFSDKLSPLKLGDEIVIMVKRNISSKELEKLVGEYISYGYYDDGSFWTLEGILQKNSKKYTIDNEQLPGKYVLIDFTISDDENGEPVESFDSLEDVCDFKIIPEKKKLRTIVECQNKKCKRKFQESFKFCPYCGHKNKH